ncbi:TOPRIM nucleotidyl transferase/hydrolase domain-containing protein [Piscinibacter sp. XHJ-5]|uniref:TOPRIM nucleotidyl transferase/hydrolase domain-containing protein n=1 Tax=Piscinibacter sp. XHJ-5 TaxID=3037797 RepID=UPI002452AB6E|nr:TOPRIM nucleotidyl transferase/hydrolase domain-containing protein [Piscinibacter sp. XHJ-5]
MSRVAGPRPPLSTAAAGEVVAGMRAQSAILVEGWSDQAAVETLAQRRGWDLRAERIVVLPIGGATNIGKFVQAFGPRGLDLRLAGLYDLGEERYVQRSLERVGLGAGLDRARTEALGFFVCEADLEDELIRAVGPAAVERVLDAEAELASFRSFQQQPYQRGRDLHAQLRRFMGTRAGRKIRYGSLLTEALDLDRVPRALGLVLGHARGMQ